MIATFTAQIAADGSIRTVDLPSDVSPHWYSLRATATDLAGNA